jgi:hypothetical protein
VQSGLPALFLALILLWNQDLPGNNQAFKRVAMRGKVSG